MPELNDPIQGPPAYLTIANGLPATVVVKDTPNALTLWLDQVNGSDSNDGLSAGQALATIAAVEAKIPVVVSQPVIVNIIEPGVYPMCYMRPRLMGAPIIYQADSDTNPNVFTMTSTNVAGVGTTASSIVGAFTPDTDDDKFIEFTSGAAVGQRRSIRTITAGEIIPAVAFNPAPVSGDSYRIFSCAVKWLATGLSSAGGFRRWLDGGGGAVSYARGLDLPIRVFSGIDFDGGGSVSRVVISSCSLVTFGCQVTNLFLPTFADSTSWYSGMDGDVLATGITADIPSQYLGAVDENAWTGWGTQFIGSAVPIVDDFRALAVGVISTRASFVWERGAFIWRGGQMRLNTAGSPTFRRAQLEITAPKASSPVPRIVNSGSGRGLSLQNGVVAYLGTPNRGLEISTASGIGLDMSASYAQIYSNVTGQGGSTSVKVRGGRLEIVGVPAYGDGSALDWDVGNGTPVNKSYFSSTGVTISDFGTNREGGVITRVA